MHVMLLHLRDRHRHTTQNYESVVHNYLVWCIIFLVSIKLRLYPTAEQEQGLLNHCNHARFMYNLGLEQRKMFTKRDRERGVKVNKPLTW